MALNQNPPAKPWVVLRMKRNAKSLYHPWFVELENHYFTPDSPAFRCSWNVALCDPRYDTSRALVIDA